MTPLSAYLTVSEIARLLKVNSITIYSYIRTRKLPAIKLGRYYRVDISDLQIFLKNSLVK